MICILTAGKTLTVAASAFTLAWTHSVEKTRWEEHWIAGPEGLTVTQGAIEGSGAGMDPPPDAVLMDGAYVYAPHVPAIPELVLAASGSTGAGWTLCPAVRARSPSVRAASPGCVTLGTRREAAIRVRWCPDEAVFPLTERDEGSG